MTQLIEKDERFELNKTASVESDQNSVIFFVQSIMFWP